MRAAWAVIACACLSACSGPPAEPAKNTTPAAPAVIDIPSAGDVALAQDVANPIRILVAPSRTYFERSGKTVHGRAVDAGVALANTLRAAAVFIETPEDKLIPDLLAGKGDMAANVILTFARDDQVAFAKPIKTGIREIIVTGPKQPPMISLEDVGGRAIHVRATSDHYASLERLNAQLKGINRPPARIVPTKGTDEDLLEMVNSGKLPATTADDYIFDLWKKSFPNISANREVSVSQDGILAWVTRKDNVTLLAAMNEFFSTHRLTF